LDWGINGWLLRRGMLKSQGAARRAAFGFIRFHTVSYGRWRGDTALYGRCAGRVIFMRRFMWITADIHVDALWE
jgi:hypothetical protein